MSFEEFSKFLGVGPALLLKMKERDKDAFPAKIVLSPRTVRYDSNDIQEYIEYLKGRDEQPMGVQRKNLWRKK